MNKLLILLLGILLISCNQNKNTVSKAVENPSELAAIADNFDWLIGEWKRNNEDDGKETYENWQKKSNSEYLGLGFTMQNGDTLKQEKIRLIKSNSIWHLEVLPQDEPEPITFKMTSFNDQEFICENKELSFPNKIKYWKNGTKIHASVSGEEMEIQFEFEKLKN